MVSIRWSRALLGGPGWVLLCCWLGCGESSQKSQAGEAGEVGTGAGGVPGREASAGASGAGVEDPSYAGGGGNDEECRPGQTRCHGQLGFQSCTPAGVWGASQSCGGYSENGTSSYCAVVDSGGGPWAACVDPACFWWLKSGLDYGSGRAGACTADGQLRACHADGILGRAERCEGVCRRVGELDGRTLGYCDPICQQGDRECLAGPLFRECVDGAWSVLAASCEDGAECQPLAKSPRPDIKCGGTCEAGTSRCAAQGAVLQRCEAGEWVEAPACRLGRCVQAGAQAQCQMECRPGEHSCAFDGAATQVVCSELGLWSAPSVCNEGSSCRVGAQGGLGCLQCVGSELGGGNAWGVADSRCDGAGVAACGAENAYGEPVSCGAGESCVELSRGAASLAYCE